MNDLSSAVAVGQQMGEAGGAMAAAAKSSRIVLMAPMLVVFALLRRRAAPGADVGKRAHRSAPRVPPRVRRLRDRCARCSIAFAPASPVAAAIVTADRLLVDVLMATVTASIGLHLEGRRLLASGWRALAVGGATAALDGLADAGDGDAGGARLDGGGGDRRGRLPRGSRRSRTG